jgi:hypothetical protein
MYPKMKEIQAAIRGLEFTAKLEIEGLPYETFFEKEDRLHPMQPADKIVFIGARYRWRLILPYGAWRCSNGETYLFDRSYYPMWKRSRRGIITPAPRVWLKNIVSEEWFFNDDTTPWYNEGEAGFHSLAYCLAVLLDWDIKIVKAKGAPSIIDRAIEATNKIQDTAWWMRP